MLPMKPAALQRMMLAVLLLLTVLTGCGRKTMVVLLPEAEGKSGALQVRSAAGEVEIDQPGEATTVRGRNSAPSAPQVLSEEEIEDRFGEVLAVLPEKPVTFTLYFHFGSPALTTDSAELLPAILESIEKRQSESISVIGHTDTSGDRRYNLRLSRQRAKLVSRLLVEEGVEEDHITTTSHGEKNPLIETGDGVREPRNRRVEVIVR